jgi:hypothetical protein
MDTDAAQLRYERDQAIGVNENLRSQLAEAREEIASLRAQLGAGTPAEYAAEAGAAIALIKEREQDPEARFAACPLHGGEEHVQVNTHGNWLCAIAQRGLDHGWTELTAVNAALHAKVDQLRAVLELIGKPLIPNGFERDWQHEHGPYCEDETCEEAELLHRIGLARKALESVPADVAANAGLAADLEALARVREIVAAYRDDQMNAVAAFGDVVRALGMP